MSAERKRVGARQQLLEVAQSMSNGSINLIEGCRDIVCLREEAGVAASSAFDVISGVASETDGYPDRDLRGAYDPEFLRKLDFEVSTYLSSVGPALLAACRDIISEMETLELQTVAGRIQ